WLADTNKSLGHYPSQRICRVCGDFIWPLSSPSGSAARSDRGIALRIGVVRSIPDLSKIEPSGPQLFKSGCLLLAQSGRPDALNQCPLLGVKRTLRRRTPMSAFDPKRTWIGPFPLQV